MNENKSGQFIGIIFLALGVVLAVKSIFHLGSLVLFNGWWTLLIIGASIYSMVKNGTNKKYIAGVIIGGVLFINCRTGFLGVIVSKLFVPIILLAIGYRLIMKDRNQNNSQSF